MELAQEPVQCMVSLVFETNARDLKELEWQVWQKLKTHSETPPQLFAQIFGQASKLDEDCWKLIENKSCRLVVADSEQNASFYFKQLLDSLPSSVGRVNFDSRPLVPLTLHQANMTQIDTSHQFCVQDDDHADAVRETEPVSDILSLLDGYENKSDHNTINDLFGMMVNR
jgi:predicted component of type VI protein secretion system